MVTLFIFLRAHSSLLSLFSDVDKQIKTYGVNELYFQLMITFYSFPILLKRQHFIKTTPLANNMTESTNIQGLSKSFENSNYFYPSHTTCIAHLSPSSLCYPWSSSYHPTNHVTVYRIFTSHMLYHHPSSHMLLVHSFHVSKPSQHTLLADSLSISALLLTCSLLC